MKFEQLLRIYWSRGFLYGGITHPFNVTLRDFFTNKSGLGCGFRLKLIKRFELSYFIDNPERFFLGLPPDSRKTINMFLSQTASINNAVSEIMRYNLIRLYLIRSYRGRCHALGKPSRGQRTWSNATTAYVCSKVLRAFIRQMTKKTSASIKPVQLNTKLIKKKVKNSKTRAGAANKKKTKA